MISSSGRRHALLALGLACALAGTACAGSDTAGTGSASSDRGGRTDQADANDADIAFLTGMTPHHQQAVEMSELVLAADPPADVAAIARQIRDAQAPEIDQMDAMLKTLGTDTTAEHGAGHDEGHVGMLSGQEMAALEAASGTEAARLYLEGMIKHHRGAIEASEAELARGQYQPALELAQQIETAQRAEITEMGQLLQDL